MKLAARILYYDQVHIDVYRTDDNHHVETAVFGGTNYHKTLISLTNQIGCPIRCDFCYGSEYRYARNITADEFLQQVTGAYENKPDIPWLDPERPLKVGFQRAGEALLNEHFTAGLEKIMTAYQPSFQLTTIMPQTDLSAKLITDMKGLLSHYPETFQINISLHTSDEGKRKEMMRNFPHLMPFKEIAAFGEAWVTDLKKRRIDLSFALMDDNIVDIQAIRSTFHPKYFSIRFASYLPSSEDTAERHTPSPKDRMTTLAEDARKAGYHVVESRAGPIEEIWDTRPFSALKLLRTD